jgi:hypothetical protein
MRGYVGVKRYPSVRQFLGDTDGAQQSTRANWQFGPQTAQIDVDNSDLMPFLQKYERRWMRMKIEDTVPTD